MSATSVQERRYPSGGEYRKRRRELASRIMALYADGRSVPSIAADLGLTQGRTASLLGQALHESPDADIEMLRGAVYVRLDKAAATFGKLLSDPDPRTRMQAAESLRRVEADRARLLGLNMKPRED